MKFLLIVLIAATSACGDSETKNNPSENNQTENNGTARLQSLVVEENGITLNGLLDIQDPNIDADEISIALRWNIEDGEFPPIPTTTSVEDPGGQLQFSVQTEIEPPDVALEFNESNGREGLAIAYIMAYIDDGNGALDCRNPGDINGPCADIFVGSSPNTLVLFGEESLTDQSPLFDFNGEPGIVPEVGWSLVHLVPNECEERPTARDWEETDQVDVVVIGDFLDTERCEQRAVNPDID